MILNLLMTARNINEFLTKKRMLKGADPSVAPGPFGSHHYLFQSCLGSSMQFNTIKCIGQRERGSSQRWQRPGRARNAFRILTNILFPVKSFKIAARTFRVPWLVGSSHYSPITTLPYHYNTFLAGHIWPVPVSEIGGRSFY